MDIALRGHGQIMFRKHPETHSQESKRLSEQALSEQVASAHALEEDGDVAVIPSSSIRSDAPNDAEITAATERHVEQAAPREPSGPLLTLDNIRLWVTAGVRKTDGLSPGKQAAIIRAVVTELDARWPTP